MLVFIGGRLLQAALVIAGVLVLTFVVLRVVPGDPARLMVPPGTAEDVVQQVREELGTDRSLPTQLMEYTARLAVGDLGESFRFREPVLDLVADRFGPTLALGLLAMVLALALALLLGTAAAYWRDTALDRAVLVIVMVAQSMPNFWVAVLLIYLLAIQVDLFPAVGMSGPTSFVLPVVTLALTLLPVLLRTVRQNTAEVLETLYVRTARAKGLSTWRTIWRHVLPNSAIPLVTVVGLQLGLVLGGTFVVEVIFNWPGVGALAFQAMQTRDFPVVQGVVIWVAAVFVVINLVVDVIYALVNPRVRLGGAR